MKSRIARYTSFGSDKLIEFRTYILIVEYSLMIIDLFHYSDWPKIDVVLTMIKLEYYNKNLSLNIVSDIKNSCTRLIYILSQIIKLGIYIYSPIWIWLYWICIIYIDKYSLASKLMANSSVLASVSDYIYPQSMYQIIWLWYFFIITWDLTLCTCFTHHANTGSVSIPLDIA